MKSFSLYFLLLGFVLLLTSCGDDKTETTERPPNILFVIADDASWKHFGAYGCDWVKTPAFDRVAKEGILFANAYTPNAKCAPSRSIILTGRNPWQLEEAANHSPKFPAKFTTYAEALGANGYWAGSTGKGWAPGDPGTREGVRRQLTGPDFSDRKLTPPAQWISTTDYAGNFSDFLQAKPADKPFVFWLGSREPHRRYEYGAGGKYAGKQLNEIDEVPLFWPDVDSVRTDMLDYAYEIEYFDGHLGRVLSELEETGELDNTIVVVTADNGMPFPRIKGQVYEYSNHLPLAIRWPKGIKNPGRTVTDLISFADLAPTFLEVAGMTLEQAGMQPMIGTSLTDIFGSEQSGRVNPDRDYILVGKERHDVGRPNDEGYPVRGIIMDGFLYLHNYETGRWPVGNPEAGYLNTDGSPVKTVLLNGRRHLGEQYLWQLNFGKRTSEELYNITDDPYCMNNLADNAEHSDRKQAMIGAMTEELMTQRDPRILGNGDIFDNYEYSGKVRDFYNRRQAGEDIPTSWVNETDFEVEPIDD